MKKSLCIFLFLLVTSLAYSQGYQRMLVQLSQLNNIHIGVGKNQKVFAKCLDYERKAPTLSASYDNILTEHQNIEVEFIDTRQRFPLKTLLGDAILLRGSTEADVLTMFKNRLLLNRPTNFILNIENRTGHPIKIHSLEDIQVGELAENPVAVSSALTQEEIWYKTSAKYRKEIEQRKKRTEIETEYDRQRLEVYEKERKRREDAIAKENKIKRDFFDKNDIGIKGTPDEVISYYESANGLYSNLPWEEIKEKIKMDIRENVHYLYDKNDNTYIPFIKSQRINGLLFRSTPYVKNNIIRLEDVLFSTKISQENIHILNFLSRKEDVETFKTLDKLFPHNQSDFSLKEIAKLKNTIKLKGVKYVFCFGHFKKGKIFTKVGNREIAYDIAQLDEIAKNLNIQVFYIGCESSIAAKGKTGTTIKVNSVKILDALFESLSSNSTLGDFFSAFAGFGKAKYNFVYEFEEHTDMIKFSIYEKEKQEGSASYSYATPEQYYDETTPKVIIGFPNIFFSASMLNLNNDDNKQSSH